MLMTGWPCVLVGLLKVVALTHLAHMNTHKPELQEEDQTIVSKGQLWCSHELASSIRRHNHYSQCVAAAELLMMQCMSGCACQMSLTNVWCEEEQHERESWSGCWEIGSGCMLRWFSKKPLCNNARWRRLIAKTVAVSLCLKKKKKMKSDF